MLATNCSRSGSLSMIGGAISSGGASTTFSGMLGAATDPPAPVVASCFLTSRRNSILGGPKTKMFVHYQ